MVELIGGDRLHQANLVNDFPEVRKHLGQFGAALSVSGEFEARPENGGIRTDESVALSADDRGRKWFPFEFRELRLVVEKVQLRRRPGHEQMNDAPGLGGKMRRLR